jgi:hypothetical protein
MALDGQPGMHDPSTIVQHDGRYYAYATGGGLPISVSDDGWTWRRGGQWGKGRSSPSGYEKPSVALEQQWSTEMTGITGDSELGAEVDPGNVVAQSSVQRSEKKEKRQAERMDSSGRQSEPGAVLNHGHGGGGVGCSRRRAMPSERGGFGGARVSRGEGGARGGP